MSILNPNWNIVGDNPIKKVFIIPVGKISREEAESIIKKVRERYRDDYDWEEEIRKQTLIDRKLKIDRIRNGYI